MKKFFAILMALIMVLAMCTCAFATTIEIEGSSGRNYNAYQLLELTTSLKTGEHHTAHSGDHTDDCYNYSYSVNDKYLAILQAEAHRSDRHEIWDGNKPATSDGVTEAQILKYLSLQSGDNGDVYGGLRIVADRLYRAILADVNIGADRSFTDTASDVEQGYWLIADVTELDGNAANSLVMVDTKGQSSLTITPKVALPTVEKKVKDINNSEDNSITDNYWYDSADHDIGDADVPFKLTATLPSNVQYYESYKLVFHDTMSMGLTFDKDTVKVYMYDTKHKADADIDLNDYTKDVTGNFAVTNTSLTDGCTFEVACENIFNIGGVTKDTAFVVYYEATLNENAVIGSAGNPNEVSLEFSNNPYDDESTGKTEKDKVMVFTYQLTINKTDSHGHALEGADFTLYKKDIDGTFNIIDKELVGTEQAPMTTFNWKGLDDGDYKLVESIVPDGFNKMEDIFFSISAVHDEKADNPKLTSLDGGQMGTGVVDTGTITKDVVNNTGTVLPETGAKGTMMIIGCSAMVIILAAVVMITRKKMSVYED